MKRYLLLFVIFFYHFTFEQKKPSVQFVPLKYENFQTFPSPITGMQPGYIFRVPKKSRSENVPVYTIGIKRDIDTMSNYIPDLSATWKSNVFIAFISSKVLGIKGNKNKEKMITVSFRDGIREQLPEKRIDELLENNKIKFKEDNDYYIINQTIKFKGLNYKLVSFKDWALDAKNYIDTMNHKAQITIKQSKNDTTSLFQEFKEPHRLFYTVLKITPRGSQMAGGKKFEYRKVDLQLQDPAAFGIKK